jgi:hypothetical protein
VIGWLIDSTTSGCSWAIMTRSPASGTERVVVDDLRPGGADDHAVR